MSATPRRGVALVAALALMVAIAGAVFALGATARPRRLAAAGAAEHLAAATVAMAGVERAHALLASLEPLSPGRLDRVPLAHPDPWSPAVGVTIGPATLGGYLYRVEIRDAFARLPLNGASEDQLRRLLAALRIDARRAGRVAQSIADWRDPDQLRRADGAERDDYLRAGRPLLPEDGPFASVAMLRFVAGMDDSLYARVEPLVTVMGDGGVNLNVAPRPVLLALPGITEEAAARILAERAAGRRVTDLDRLAAMLPPGAREALRAATPLLRNVVTFDTREVHVVSEAWAAGGVTRVRVDAIISRNAEGRITWRAVTP